MKSGFLALEQDKTGKKAWGWRYRIEGPSPSDSVVGTALHKSAEECAREAEQAAVLLTSLEEKEPPKRD